MDEGAMGRGVGSGSHGRVFDGRQGKENGK